MDEYLSDEGVCQMIPGSSKQWLAQLRFLGTGPKYLKPTPRKVIYKKGDVIDWLERSGRYGTHSDKVAS